jgi:hypothetical protein
VVSTFNNNVLTKNTLGPACVSSEVAGVLDPASTYSGNDRDQIVVKPQYVSKAATWAVTEVPYFLETGLRVDADWTIAPGVTLIMAKEAGLDISGDAGALIAQGTAAKPIRFTGATSQRGAWDGITFDGSNNTRNVLANATVEYGGDTTHDKDAAAVQLTADSHGVQLKMSQTTIKESQGWGLYLSASAVVPQFEGNTLTKNQLGPASVDSDAAHQLLAASSYTGNDVDRVMVRTNRVSKAVTWEAIGVPYLIDGGVHVDLVWTLAPGVTLMMGSSAWISVAGTSDSSALHAVGTAAKPILITGATKKAGAWESIIFDTTLNGANAFDYCTIEYGGGGTAKGNMGMIIAQSDSHGVTLSLTNSTIQHSAVYGLWQGKYASVNQSGDTFADNVLWDTYKQP